MEHTFAEIKEYWNSKAAQLGTDPSATMKDVLLRGVEIQAIAARLRQQDEVIDIGCGNAFGSIEFSKHCRQIVAADFSEKMIEAARAAIETSGQSNIRTAQVDVTNMERFDSAFTATICVRCLINLPTEEAQYGAIDQLALVLKPGGRLLIVEGIAEHFAALNRMRQSVGLPAIVLDWHNKLFETSRLEAALRRHFDIEEVVDFGEYYFLSRILHPLTTAPDQPTFSGRINHEARKVWESGISRHRFADISVLVLYVCRKRA